MARHQIVPNELQGGQSEPVWIEGLAPPGLTRLGAAKVEFLVRGVAQLRSSATVLELFGGTGLSTAIIAAELTHPERLVSVDLHYARGAWRYCAWDNYRQQLANRPAHRPGLPRLICADAAHLPLADACFDCVIAPDSPRTRFDASGVETSLDQDAQRQLFLAALHESLRVLKPGGLFAATAPRSWVADLPNLKIITAPSERLRFKTAADPVVYLRIRK
ncbi:MAG: class I SAM-dependent methyltransferase [Planctomycetaceae bacterium]|nr:class I SAM-dependent methyltransferase [Planctomycetaceae bacterium]